MKIKLPVEVLERLNKFKKIKELCCLKIKQGCDLSTPERRLWFAVIERAIADIGEWEVRESKSGRSFNIPAGVNSDEWFNSERFQDICDFVDIDPGYILKILQRHGVLPVKRHFYDSIRFALDL